MGHGFQLSAVVAGWFLLGEFLEFFCSCWVLFNCRNCCCFRVYVFVGLMLFMSFHGVLGEEFGSCGVLWELVLQCPVFMRVFW